MKMDYCCSRGPICGELLRLPSLEGGDRTTVINKWELMPELLACWPPVFPQWLFFFMGESATKMFSSLLATKPPRWHWLMAGVSSLLPPNPRPDPDYGNPWGSNPDPLWVAVAAGWMTSESCGELIHLWVPLLLLKEKPSGAPYLGFQEWAPSLFISLLNSHAFQELPEARLCSSMGQMWLTSHVCDTSDLRKYWCPGPERDFWLWIISSVWNLN